MDEIACDKTPISYDMARYASETRQICHAAHTMSAAEYEKEMANPNLAAFGVVFFPKEWIIWHTELGGDAGQYGFIELMRGKQQLALTPKELRAAIEGIATLQLFSKEPGKIEWHGATEVGGYAVEFYSQEQMGMFGVVLSECLVLSRYTDGTAESHKSRIVGTYCEASMGEPLDQTKAEIAIAAIRHRPELAH
jgi:hypothetical protein